MEPRSTTMLRIGAWVVNPLSSQISRDGETARVGVRVEVRTMRLLLFLAEHAGAVVSIDDLLSHVWPEVSVSPDSVYQAVASLRRLLGDDPKQSTYIETVPRLGYRMVATVSPWADQAIEAQLIAEPGFVPPSTPESSSAATPVARQTGLKAALPWIAAAALCFALGVAAWGFLFHGGKADNNSAARAATPQPQKSIAVLPFLDLTEGMKNEEFADGMTEELIDKLSKIPGLRVPSPTSSFYFKGKQIPVADIARSLGVAFVLDGSVRKSGDRVRIAARLVRTDTGYVVWTESYDRPFNDILMVQDDIAGEVTKALSASSEFKAR